MNIPHHLWEEQSKWICYSLGRWCGWVSDKNSQKGVFDIPNNLKRWPRASECAAARWASHVTGNRHLLGLPHPHPTLVAPPLQTQLEVVTALGRPLLSAGPHFLAPHFTPPPGTLTGSVSQRPAITSWWHPHCMLWRTEGQQVPGTGQAG